MTEKEIITRLEILARNWPKTSWIFVASGEFYVMSTDPEGKRVYIEKGGVDPRYIVKCINIPCDGGDW